MENENVDLILHSGSVLTVNDEDQIIEKGAIAIKNKKIVAIASTREIKGAFSAPEMIDAKGGIIMPGLINTHTHLAMSIFRGIADDLLLDEWLNRFMFPLEDKFINRDSARLGSLLSCAEMILSGTTTFCDMYFFEKETGLAAKKTGMRAVIGEGIVTMGEKDMASWTKKKALTKELMSTFKNDDSISIAVEPHSPYTCNAVTLKKAKRFAKQNNLLYAIHLAETKKEFSDFAKKEKITPVEYLDSLGVLDENTLAAHTIWISKQDMGILKKRQVKIAHCPQSNMKLGSGIAPIRKMLKNDITVGLGTDGSASNNILDMFCEMKSAALLAKASDLDAKALPAKEIIRMATIEGAKALGKEAELGSLEVGKKADVIVIDTDSPHLTPIYDYYSHLAYCAVGSDVKTSIINGKVVMQNRRIVNIDIKDIMAKVNLLASKIKDESEKSD